MTPERHRQVGQLYHAALERGAEERVAFLQKACGQDEELRQEVESLLSAHDKVGNYFAAPAIKMALGQASGEQNRSLVGQNLSHYRVLSLIGTGGMGEVFLAEDTRLGRKVALKLLPREFTKDAERVRRFEQEARAASALNHPNIITIHEIGEADGAHYIVSEFVEGETLRTLIERGEQGINQATAIAEQVAGALSVAHEAGIIHRDIKPENVIVRPDGLVKVLDFGLAKLTEAKSPPEDSQGSTGVKLSTEPGMVMGTVSYMSPEQARGLKVDQRTDIFSLGVMLYEMVTGRRPFEGETASDIIAAILQSEPAPVSQARQSPVAELDQVIGRMIEKDRENRYQSAAELRAELRRLQRKLEADEPADTEETPGSITAGRPTGETKQERPTVVTGGERGHSRSPLLRRWRAAAAIGLVVLGLAAVIYLTFFPGSPVSPPTEINSLAVLPLENLSGDPAQEYFADGMTDALIGDLAKIGALRVISRTSAMRYKGMKKPLLEIAKELNVEAVVEGTVVRVGDRVGIRVQLIEAASERHLWGKTYERDVRDVLGLQGEIAQTIAREIQAKITSAEQLRLARNRPVNRKALDDYLQGYYYLNHRTEESLRQALEYFQSAISADPTYAPAYAQLAGCYNRLSLVFIGALPPTEARRRAEEAAEKALELDSELAEAHAALGYVKHYNWDWDAAEQALKHAIELNPNYADAHNIYAHYLSTRGRAEEAIAEANRAQELDPLSLSFSVGRGFILTNARRYDEAIEQFRRVIAVDPNPYMAHWFLAYAYAANGQFDEAIATSEKAVALSGRAPGALGVLGISYGLAGRKGEANKILNELLELDRRRYVTPAAVVNVYIGLGNKDQAFVWLEKAYQERSNYMAYLKVFPLVDPLRSDPRFDDLLRQIGLAP